MHIQYSHGIRITLVSTKYLSTKYSVVRYVTGTNERLEY